MDALWQMLMLVLTVGALGCAVYYGAVVYHIARATVRIPAAAAGLRFAEAKAGDPPRVCVIIPAHNEEASIGPLARSLREQDHPNLHAVFCLDRCTDATEEILRAEIGPAGDGRFTVLPVTSCPPDWAGKVHAIWRGVSDVPAAREAELLLFADADTSFHPSCVRAAASLLRHRRLGMLSLLSTLEAHAWFERLVQPAASLELLRQYPLIRANARERPRAFANGQFMLFTREAYERVGGHAAAREAILEDIELARLCAKAKVPIGLFPAGRMLRCRMYESWPHFRRGWKRIYTEAGNRRPARLARSARRLRLVGAALPLAGAAALAGGLLGAPAGEAAGLAPIAAWSGAAGLTTFLAAIAAFSVRAGAGAWAAPLYPIGAWLTADILAEAAADLREGRPMEWAGRSYVREAR